jgi:hypothetical protein
MSDLKLQGKIDLMQVREEGNWKKIDWQKIILSKLEIGRSRISAEIENKGAKGYQAVIKGAVFDARPFMEGGREKTIRQKTPPMRISFQVDKLITGQQEEIKKARIFIKRDNWSLVDQFEMDGIAGKGSIYIRYLPDNVTKGHSFRLEANDAGAALQALDITKAVRGGKLFVSGSPDSNGALRDIVGKAQLSDFHLVNISVLAKLLNAMSLTGIGELLSDKGIKFSRLKTDFFWTEKYDPKTGKMMVKTLRLKKGRTSGASLGINFSGIVDKLNENLDLKGTIVPVSGLNKVIGQIPILGQILTGGSNAVFAATYTIKGPISKPTTMVNPLAALAPGILRRIFFENDL